MSDAPQPEKEKDIGLIFLWPSMAGVGFVLTIFGLVQLIWTHQLISGIVILSIAFCIFLMAFFAHKYLSQ